MARVQESLTLVSGNCVEIPKAYFEWIFAVFFVRHLPAFSSGTVAKRSHRRLKTRLRSQAGKKEATNLQLDRQELPLESPKRVNMRQIKMDELVVLGGSLTRIYPRKNALYPIRDIVSRHLLTKKSRHIRGSWIHEVFVLS